MAYDLPSSPVSTFIVVIITLSSSAVTTGDSFSSYNFGGFSFSGNEHKILLHLLHIPETIRSWLNCLHNSKDY